MRHIIKEGNIYKVLLKNKEVRYFQFIGKDISELNSDVIRIFKRHYQNEETLNPETIVNDEIECYMHTSIRAGLKLGLWEKVAFVMNTGMKDVVFRESNDCGEHPFQQIVSHDWVIWRMNGERINVGELPPKYYHANIGGVYAPIHVVFRLETGNIPDRYYPLYL